MYIVHCILHSEPCTLHILHGTLYTTYYTQLSKTAVVLIFYRYQVKGYVKTDSYIPGSLPSEEENGEKNHWNHIQIESSRFTVDCCRGAGIVKNGNFEPMYALTSLHKLTPMLVLAKDYYVKIY